MKLYTAQIKRELWENKVSFIYTPLIISFLIIILVACAALYSKGRIDNSGSNFHFSSTEELPVFGLNVPDKDSPQDQGLKSEKAEVKSFNSVALVTADSTAFSGMVMGVMYSNCAILYLVFAIVFAAYALRCLFDDRKNKDILFWRSMPVSETTNVMVKLLMIFFVGPLVIFLLNIAVYLAIFILGAVYFTTHGVALSYLVSSVLSGGGLLILVQIFYELVFSLLMLLPIIGYALFSSAYARKTPFFIFAAPLLLGLADKILDSFFGINFGVLKIFSVYGNAIVLTKDAFLLQHPLYFTQAMIFPLFACVAIGAAFIAASIWLRNNRYEI